MTGWVGFGQARPAIKRTASGAGDGRDPRDRPATDDARRIHRGDVPADL